LLITYWRLGVLKTKEYWFYANLESLTTRKPLAPPYVPGASERSWIGFSRGILLAQELSRQES
jgi:hypothetical protein